MPVTKAETSCVSNSRQHARRRGAMLVLIVLLLLAFIGMVAFSVDVAYMQLVRTQLRIATDAAARAAGEALSRDQDLDQARDAAKRLAAEHLVASEPLLLDDDDVVPGNVSQQPGGKWSFNEAGTPINGLRVKGRRTRDSLSGAVKLFFGTIFGVGDYETSHQAVVVQLDRDICLVVDRSSSMKLTIEELDALMSTSDPRFCQPPGPESRWAALDDAVRIFTSTLDVTDPIEHVALVSYASDGTWCGIVNQAASVDQGLTEDLQLIESAVSTIGGRVFNGNTEISQGIDKGVLVLTDAAYARPFAAKTMIVFTDGHQQGGRSPEDAAGDAAQLGITVHTITFGDGANQTQMQAVAEAGGGTHHHASDADELKDVFREIALTLPVLLTE